MTPDVPQISVIIVSWNVKESLCRCLDSIFTAKYPRLEVIVLDNNSSDGTASEVKKKFAHKLKLIANRQNLGFPKAVNQGLVAAKGEYFLILNPDTRLPADFFRLCLDFARQNPGFGVMGPRFTDPDGSSQGSVFPEPTLVAAIRKYWLGDDSAYNKYTPEASHPVSVNSVSGGCLFFSRSTMEKIGMLTEKVFMYFEDLDFCRRIRRAGLPVIFHPGITIIHEHGQSTAKSPDTQKYIRDAGLWYHGPFKYYLITAVIRSRQIIDKIISGKRS